MATNGATNGASSHPSIIPLWIGGKEVSDTTETFEVVSPVTNKPIYKSASASLSDANNAVAAAEAAFPAWSRTKPSHRRDIFLKAAQQFDDRKEELWTYIHEETGAPRQFHDYIIGVASGILRDVGGRIASALTGSVPELAEEGSSAIVYKQPYGVVLGIAPWNAPWALGLRAIAYALAAGNTVILKGPELSPRTYWALGDIFSKAGLPAGALSVLVHRPADAAAITESLIANPAIRKVNFTGSTAVGSIIASLAGKHLKPVLMELGGKAPAIVCEDADIQKAALQCALGALLHSGQICMSTERILVNRKIVEPFREALKGTVSQIFGKDPSILVASAPVAKNQKLLADAVSKGAKPLFGDPNLKQDSNTRMLPVVMEGVNKDMDLYHTESFGPTVSLFVVDSDEEAIELANDTEYGLTSAVFTEDLRRGLKIAKEIQAGAVHINGMSVHDEVALPHGGWKKSGFGRFNASAGLEEFLQSKTVTWKD